jgi:hypothetical protein
LTGSYRKRRGLEKAAAPGAGPEEPAEGLVE